MPKYLDSFRTLKPVEEPAVETMRATANPFDQFDNLSAESQNPFDQFDSIQPQQSQGAIPYIEAAKSGNLSKVRGGDWLTNPYKRSRIYRPLLEGAGMVVGGVLGAAGGVPTGPGAIATSAALAGTGYAIGHNAADWLDYKQGIRKESPTGAKAFKQAAVDVATGATYDLGGQLFMATLLPVANGVSYGFKKAAGGVRNLFSKKAIEESAGRVLVAETKFGTAVAKNIKQAREIEKLINEGAGPNDPKIKFSWAQLTDSPGAIKLERSLTRQPGQAADIQAEQIRQNSAALARHYDKAFGGEQGADDMIKAIMDARGKLQARTAAAQEGALGRLEAIPRKSPGETGQQITGKLESAQAPYKSAMNELESQIPDYPMKFDNTMSEIDSQLASKKISMAQRQALENAKNDMGTMLEQGSTTHTAFGVRRTLNDRISEAFRSGNDSVGAILMKVKAGVESDLADVAAMARTGKISDYKGKAVDVDMLSGQLESNTQQIAKMRGTQKPDVDKMFDELSARGGPSSSIWMRQRMEGEEAYRQRLSEEYERAFGKPAPTIEDAGVAANVSRMEKANEEIRGILKEVSPGQDVASLMKAYNDFASSEYFSRFGTASVKGVLQKGAQATGKKIAAESVPAKFMTESGSADLIRALGKEKAAGLMKGHFAYDMWSNVRGPMGTIDSKALARWYRNNSEGLKRFGLADEFNQVARAQAIADEAGAAAAEFEKTAAKDFLKADPERAVANAIKGNRTGKAAEELMQIVKGNEAATEGLRNAFAEHIRQDFMATNSEFIKTGVVKNNAFQRVFNKYRPAIKVLYKDSPKQMKALETMRDAYEILVRNMKSPIGGGSDTTENAFMAIADRVHISRTASTVKHMIKFFQKANKAQTNEVLTMAFFNPEYAETLINGIKGIAPAKEVEKAINKKIIELNAYRTARNARAAAAGVLTMVGNGDDSRLSDR